MKVWEETKRLTFRELLILSKVLIAKPLYIFPTLMATRQTIKICDLPYGSLHHQHGKANAFRHALWSILLCQKIYKMTKDITTSGRWAKRITDLHNNKISRTVFENLKNLERNRENEIISFLNEKLNNAIKVDQISQIYNIN